MQKLCQLLPTHISPPIVKKITATERDEKVTRFFSGFYSDKANPILLAPAVWAFWTLGSFGVAMETRVPARVLSDAHRCTKPILTALNARTALGKPLIQGARTSQD